MITPVSSRDEYEWLVESLVRASPEDAAEDPFYIATGVLPSVERDIEPEQGVVLGLGTAAHAPWTFYPTDVLLYSQQPVAAVTQRFHDGWGGTGAELTDLLYAHYTLTLDIADANAELFGGGEADE